MFLLLLLVTSSLALWCPPLTGAPSHRMEVLIRQTTDDGYGDNITDFLHWYYDASLHLDRMIYIEDQIPSQEIIYRWNRTTGCGGEAFNVQLDASGKSACQVGPIPSDVCQGELAVIPADAECVNETQVPGYPEAYLWRTADSVDYVGYFIELPNRQEKIVLISETYPSGAVNFFEYFNWMTPFPDAMFDPPSTCTHHHGTFELTKRKQTPTSH